MVRGETNSRESRLLAIVAKSVVRPSFERCCESGEDFFDTFYGDLADRVPGVGAMFAATDMRKQNALVREGIDALISHAEGDITAAEELARLGRLHGRDILNIQPSLYAGWADALRHAVAQFDPKHTDLVDAAWGEVLADGIALMASFY